MSVKKYLRAYGDLNELMGDVERLQSELDQYKQNIFDQFSMGDYVDRRVNEQIEKMYSQYHEMTQPDKEYIGRVQEKLSHNEQNLEKIRQQIRDVSELIKVQEESAQNDFEKNLISTLNQQQNEFDEIEERAMKIQFNVDQRKSKH